MKSVDEIGTYMWHAGAHHIGYDVHDVVERPEFIASSMMFCVDIGIIMRPGVSVSGWRITAW